MDDVPPAGGALRVLYLAHDLDDVAIWRRVAMLQRGGAVVRVAGFRRGDGPLRGPAAILGRTRNARMAQRAGTVLRALPGLRRRLASPGFDVVIARNLEMLVLGGMLARGAAGPRLVYELLDIHGMMLGQGVVPRALRGVEGALLRRCATVILSSPGFVTHYLTPFGQPAPAVLLVENKPLAPATPIACTDAAPRLHPVEAGRLTIGWFGILRCRWSLQTLDALTRAAPGRYRVALRGRPALDVMPDFHDIVAANPDLTFSGPYIWPDDLAGIYAGVDLAWMIDRYQSGQNSDWLLPNRLYEGCLHGAAPVALAGTEVSRRLEALGIGLVVPAPDGTARSLAALDPAKLAQMRSAVASLPRQTWEAGDAECRALVRDLRDAGAAPGAGARSPGSTARALA